MKLRSSSKQNINDSKVYCILRVLDVDFHFLFLIALCIVCAYINYFPVLSSLPAHFKPHFRFNEIPPTYPCIIKIKPLAQNDLK